MLPLLGLSLARTGSFLRAKFRNRNQSINYTTLLFFLVVVVIFCIQKKKFGAYLLMNSATTMSTANAKKVSKNVANDV